MCVQGVNRDGDDCSPLAAELDELTRGQARDLLGDGDRSRIDQILINRDAEVIQEDAKRGHSTDDKPSENQNDRRQHGEDDEKAPKVENGQRHRNESHAKKHARDDVSRRLNIFSSRVDEIFRVHDFLFNGLCRVHEGVELRSKRTSRASSVRGDVRPTERLDIAHHSRGGAGQPGGDGLDAIPEIGRFHVNDDTSAEAEKHKQKLNTLRHVQRLASVRHRSEAASTQSAALAHRRQHVEDQYQKHRHQ